MNNEYPKYPCPCCGKKMLDQDDNYVCYYCGWNDATEERGDEDGGINVISLNQAKDLVQQGKNIAGGKLPYFQ